jgi:Ti-type conjugative transfer relaxase TraA
MMSIAKLKAGAENYYLSLARATYYNDGGEPAGQWLGQGIQGMGLSGEVEDQPLVNLMQGFDPITGKPLVQAHKNHVAAWDCTFSAPKSCSIVWALADKELQDRMAVAQQVATAKAVAYLEEQAITRRGKDGAIHERPKGIMAASFQHSTSREADMQLHTHVLIANVCEREDGTFGTLESKPFFAHKMTAGAIYRAELAASLRSMGFNLVEDAKDNFKIVGVSNEACKQFSKRRDAIEDYLSKQGLRDAKSSAKAALATRETKEELCFADKIEDWKQEAKPFGIDAQSIETMRTYKAPEAQPPTVEEVLRQLTETASTFREQDIVRVLAVKAQTAVFDRQALLEEIKASPELLRLTAFDDGQKRFTSREMRMLEEGILTKTLAGKDSTRHQVNEDLVAQGIAQIEAKNGFELNAEQREAVRFIAQKTGTVACVEGMAGTGKTTMLEAARVVLERAGMNVHGCALAGKAAQGLQDGAGIQSHTIHSLLLKLEKGEVAFNEKSVVVMDESGMVGSRLYAALLDRIEAAGGKLILVGDYRQLQPIDAGGMFKQITKATGSTELVEIRRQKQEWHREAVHDLAAGNADKAIQAFADKGLIHVADERAQAIESMVKAWHADTTDVKEKLMLAATRFETRVLNEAARELLKTDGSIQEGTAFRVECADEIEREFCVGDRILFLKNDAQLAVKNGTLGFVREIAFMPEGAPVFTVECDDGEAKTINLERYSDIAHGLCVSVHKSQGATVDTAYMLTNENMGDREWSYVAASRSRHETRIFTTAEEFDELSARMARSRQKDSSLDYEIVQAQPEKPELENASVASTPARSSEVMEGAPPQPNAQGVPLTGAAQGSKLADLKAAFAALWTALKDRADRVKQEPNQTVAVAPQLNAKPQRETAGLEM